MQQRLIRMLPFGVVIFALVLAGSAFANSPPVVTEVWAQQRPEYGNKVYVHYKVQDADGDLATIRLYLSVDGGTTFPILCNSVVGDVGEGVAPGFDSKVIWWDAKADYPGHSGETYAVRVFAEDDPATGLVHSWSRRFGDAGSQAPYDVALDGSGNVVVIGTFQGTINLGGVSLTSNGGADIFVAGFDVNGVHRWSRRLGDASPTAYALSVATDAMNDVILAGSFQGSVDLGGGVLTSAGGDDVFVAKLDVNGVHQWSQRFGTTGDQTCNTVAVDQTGSAVLIGSFAGSVDFGGGTLTSAGASDIFLAKLNSNGTHQWSRRYGNSSFQWGTSVAVDNGRNIIITGSFNGTVNFGGASLTNSFAENVYLAKFNEAGVHQWSYQFGDQSAQHGNALVASADGSIFVAGDFGGTVNFGGGALQSVAGDNIFLAKLNANGAHQWSHAFAGGYRAVVASPALTSLAVDALGTLIVVDDFLGTIDFGGGPLTSAGSDDVFVAVFDTNGVHQWSRRFGNFQLQSPASVAFDAAGRVAIVGRFEGTVDFGGGVLTSAGDTDVFVVRFMTE